MGNEALNRDGLSKNESSTDVRGINGGGGGHHIWKGWGCLSEIWIKPLKETDLGVAQAFFDP